MELATREIYWSIPSWFIISMYTMMFIAIGIMIKGLIPKYRYITNGKSIKELLPEKFQFKKLFQTIFFTGKVTRKGLVGLFHSLIYYGFFILFIATELVALHTDTPFRFFQGWVYITISFLADLAGLAVLTGLIIAYKRRYIDKPKTLSATKPTQEKFMYAVLATLIVVGFILEGIRLAATGLPENEKIWSPIGSFIGVIINSFGINDFTLSNIYKGLWFFHMANTMFFIASIPYTKFFHIIMAPLAAFITPPRRGAVLKRMNFEDETKETFGLGKVSEMSMKHRFDTLACVECGRCTEVCPANKSGKPLNPKTIITKARDLATTEITTKPQEEIDFWENNTYSATELDSCTNCGACMEECPMNIEHVDLIMELKRYKTLTLGEINPDAGKAINNIKVQGNPWGLPRDDRFKWADGLEVPVIEIGKKVEYLYYIGCAGAYELKNQKTTRDTINLLKKAGVDFAVIGKHEVCNGDPVRRLADEYSFEEIAIENIKNINQYSFDKILTHCPHGLHTIGKEYKQFKDGNFEVVHHTELLSKLIKDGKLVPKNTVNEKITYHDPCFLGRHHGAYEAPRNIIKALPGATFIEMKHSKDKALCCGMGGGNMWQEIHEGTDMVQGRLEHIAETEADKVATACSYCMINFESGKGKNKDTENTHVEDIASILNRSVE